MLMKKLKISIYWLLLVAYVYAVPQTITFQGRLTESNVPVTATRNMRFAIVDSTGTTTYWQSNASNAIPVSVNQGIYTINLGDTSIGNMAALTPDTLDITTQAYLRVWVAGTLLTPDIPLNAAPYAYLAAKATSANYATTANYAIYGVPPGTVQMYAGNVLPQGWLWCDGATVNRTIYTALFAVVGTTFGTGDGSTTFNLPDMRGASAAGAGTSTGYAQNETITLGTKYNDQFQGHYHALDAETMFTKAGYPQSLGASGGANWAIQSATGTKYASTVYPDTVNGTPRIGTVTRGKVVGFNFIIKY